jgi:hypothetical protein
VHPTLRASWWWRAGTVAGSARPGFGRLPWAELDAVEAALLSWIGSRPGHEAALDGLADFLDMYLERRRAHAVENSPELRATVEALTEPDELRRGLDRLAERTGVRGHLRGGSVDIEAERLDEEAELLRQSGIEVLVSLMEREPDDALAAAGWEVHHFALDDMLPPRREQVEALAGLLADCSSRGKAVAVHCLAGIGRTTTMLAGTELLQGRSLEDVSLAMAAANPSFRQVGPQWEFLRTLADAELR